MKHMSIEIPVKLMAKAAAVAALGVLIDVLVGDVAGSE
jgi:hypothetical protein